MQKHSCHKYDNNQSSRLMSSEDSVNMVYRCMLRGAADFLVKPIRKNELSNLWQHVWRRTTTSGRQGPQDESVAQLKVEATAENNAASNHSSGYMACIERNRECIEKGSDAQSSCTKPDLEPEKTCAENMQDFSQPSCKKPPAIDVNIQKHEEGTKSSRKLFKHACADNGLEVGACNNVDTMTRGEDVAHESPKVHSNIIIEPFDQPLANSSREAIDLIGTLGSSSLNNGTNDRDSSLLLDLSLRRSHPSGSINQVSDERHPLNHSEASAFSRYINRPLRPQHSSASTCNQQKDYGTGSGRQLSIHTPDYNSGTDVLTPKSQKSILSMVTGRAEVAFPHPQRAVIPVSVPVTGLGFGGLSTAYGSVVPTTICPQSRQSTVQNPGSVCHLEPSFQANAFHPSNLKTRNSGQFHDLIDQNRSNSINQTEHKQMHMLASPEDRNHISSAGDQSASNSLWNGTASPLNNIGCISNANIDQVAAGQTTAESGNEGGLPMHDRSCHRSVQREAALTKFRLKRKDRCYEKKVRYESRKKLAEQRPRVKGQFVRQVHTDPAPVQTDNHSGNSLDG
ncbi:two-component response regulator-like APRR5 isoform X2 [Diospyros lotus]|uniref:two-component response regulator-like APRR5 isoform X2 n=1 Tax=Diospyros lotus TaxID=55363 RepID=UPI0022513206|nr:two-component response regulator-like APRR5 isoform X2 [Diospyros lotus]